MKTPLRTPLRLAAAMALALAVAGTGPAWGGDGPLYLRGDLGYGWSRDARITDTGGGAGALYGPGNSVAGDFGSSVALGLGVGYRVLDPLRVEATVHWLPGLRYDGATTRSGALVRADASAFAAMLNVAVDVDRLHGDASGPLHPYVTAGLGAARTHVGALTTRTAAGTVTSPGGEAWRFAWSLGFGTAIDLTDALSLDLGYRYFDLGKVETDRGAAAMATPAGTVPGTVDPVTTKLRAHVVTLGLRYAF